MGVLDIRPSREYWIMKKRMEKRKVELELKSKFEMAKKFAYKQVNNDVIKTSDSQDELDIMFSDPIFNTFLQYFFWKINQF